VAIRGTISCFEKDDLSESSGCIRGAVVSRAELLLNPNYVCPRCCGQTRSIDGRPVTQVDEDGTLLDVEASFCYLGDMCSAGGGCSLAIVTRCCTAWGKKLLPILTSKHISLTVPWKVFDACVHSALLHGSEPWARPLQTCNGSAKMTDQ